MILELLFNLCLIGILYIAVSAYAMVFWFVSWVHNFGVNVMRHVPIWSARFSIAGAVLLAVALPTALVL